MLRILDISEADTTAAASDHSLLVRPPLGVTRWIDLTAPTTEELERLRVGFDFHPLAIEDCAQFDQRPKLEEYQDHLFIVTHTFESAGDAIPKLSLELHAFLGQRYLVTVHDHPCATLDQVFARAGREPRLGQRGPDYLYYLVADALADANLPVLDLITEEMAHIEDATVGHAPSKQDIALILTLKRELLAMRRVIAPQREVFARLAKSDIPQVSERTAPYFREVFDAVLRVTDGIEAAREQLTSTMNAHFAVVSNRTNEVMKSLTLLSAIFLPLTFITGFFGQNFTHLPFDSKLLLGVMGLTCLGVPAVMLWWFRRHHWL